MDFSFNFQDESDTAVDTEADDRAIQAFLDLKLQELRTEITETQQELDQRREHVEKCFKNLKLCENFDSSNLEITKTWQRIFNDRWIIGVQLENKQYSPAENLQVLLRCNEKNPFEFETKIYTRHQNEIKTTKTFCDIPEINEILNACKSNQELQLPLDGEWILSHKIKNTTTIIITSKIPSFTNTTKITVSGVLLFEQFDKKYQLPLSDQTLGVDDVIAGVIDVKTSDVLLGVDEDYLSVLSVNRSTNVHAKITEDTFKTLEDHLQLACSFRKIGVIARNNVFVYNGLSDALRGTLLRPGTALTALEMMTRDESQLKLLLHHLYKNIPDIVIHNEECEPTDDEESTFLARPTQCFQQIENRAPDQGRLRDFISDLQVQMKFVENNLLKYASTQGKVGGIEKIDLSLTKDEYKSFRYELCEMEEKTDRSYLELFKK